MRTRRVVTVGLVVTAAYVVATMATGQLRPGRARPLFDGFTPPPAYRWVNPPPEFRSGNQKALSGKLTPPADLGPAGPTQLEAATDDAQVLITFSKTGVPPAPGATGATVEITALDPASLGPLPHGIRVDGNGYKVAMGYLPSGASIPALVQPGNIFLSYPTTADRIEYSPDGKAWQSLSAQQVGNNLQLGAVFTKAGYYEAAAPGSAPLTKRSGSGGLTTGLLIMAAVAFVIFTPLIVLFVRRRPGKTPQKKRGPKKRR